MEATVFVVKLLLWCLIPDNGAEDGEELSGAGEKGDAFGFPAEAPVEGSGPLRQAATIAPITERAWRGWSADDEALDAPLSRLAEVGEAR